jgi:transcriptional regulator with XRE-family HTH domain
MENHSTQSPAETEEVRLSLDAQVASVVTELIERSRLSQRELVERSGLSKDQLSRSLRGARQIELNEALAILSAAGLPGRGALTLALYDRSDLAIDWSESGLSAFLETLIAALPDALTAVIGDECDRINPRWGQQAARFVAQRIGHHIQELVEREERLGEFEPMRHVRSA